MKSNSREYTTWINMKQRCNNPNNIDYKHYGGRGITICERWLESFDNFYADMGPKPEGMSIDRIDNNKGYEPGNCKWSNQIEQIRNRRNRGTSTGIEHIFIQKSLRKPYIVKEIINGKAVWYGNYLTLEEAKEALAAKLNLAKLAHTINTNLESQETDNG